ncbi:MAG: hypothetical protein U0325_20025 [Polyangiales bacterium]
MLDEPTNDLDVATLNVLEPWCRGWLRGHRDPRLRLPRPRATSILSFEGEGRAVRYAGGWSDYRAQRAYAEAERARPVEAPKPAEAPKPVEPAKKKLTLAEAKELDALPGRIDAADAEVQALEARLADPSIYVGTGAEVPGLMASLEKAKAAAEALLTRWEQLESRRG